MDLTKLQAVTEVVATLFKTLECAICLELMEDPLSTGCHHNFCRNCIQTVMKKKYKASCPLCKAAVTRRGLYKNLQLVELVNTAKELHESVKLDTGYEVSPPRAPRQTASTSHNLESDLEIFNLLHPPPVKLSESSNKRVRPTRKGKKRKMDVYEDEGSSTPAKHSVSSNVNVSACFSVQRRSPLKVKKKAIPVVAKNQQSKRLVECFQSSPLLKRKVGSLLKRRRLSEVPTFYSNEDQSNSSCHSVENVNENCPDAPEEHLVMGDQILNEDENTCDLPSTWVPELKKETGSRDYSKLNSSIVTECENKSFMEFNKDKSFQNVSKVPKDCLSRTYDEVMKVPNAKKIFKSRNKSATEKDSVDYCGVIETKKAVAIGKKKTVDVYTFFPSQKTPKKRKVRRTRNKRTTMNDSTIEKHMDVLSTKYKEKVGISQRFNDMVLSSSELSGVPLFNKENKKKICSQNPFAEVDSDFAIAKKPLKQIQEDASTLSLFCTPSTELSSSPAKQQLANKSEKPKKHSRVQRKIPEMSRIEENVPSTQDKIEILVKKIADAELFDLDLGRKVSNKSVQKEFLRDVSNQNLDNDMASSKPASTDSLKQKNVKFSTNSEQITKDKILPQTCEESSDVCDNNELGETNKKCYGTRKSPENKCKTGLTKECLYTSGLKKLNSEVEMVDGSKLTKVVNPTEGREVVGLRRGKLSRKVKESEDSLVDQSLKSIDVLLSQKLHISQEQCEIEQQEEEKKTEDDVETPSNSDVIASSAVSTNEEETFIDQIGDDYNGNSSSDSESEPIPFIYMNRSLNCYQSEVDSSQLQEKVVFNADVQSEGNIKGSETAFTDDGKFKYVGDHHDEEKSCTANELQKHGVRKKAKTETCGKNEDEKILHECNTSGLASKIESVDIPREVQPTSGLADGMPVLERENTNTLVDEDGSERLQCEGATIDDDGDDFDIENLEKYIQKSDRKTFALDTPTLELEELGRKASTLDIIDEVCANFGACDENQSQAVEAAAVEECKIVQNSEKLFLEEDVFNSDGEKVKPIQKSTHISIEDQAHNSISEILEKHSNEELDNKLIKETADENTDLMMNSPINEKATKMDSNVCHDENDLIPSLLSSLHSENSIDFIEARNALSSQTNKTIEFVLSAVGKNVACPGCNCNLDVRFPNISIIFNKDDASCCLNMGLILSAESKEIIQHFKLQSRSSHPEEYSVTVQEDNFALINPNKAEETNVLNGDVAFPKETESETVLASENLVSVPKSTKLESAISHGPNITCSVSNDLTDTDVEHLLQQSQISLSNVAGAGLESITNDAIPQEESELQKLSNYENLESVPKNVEPKGGSITCDESNDLTDVDVQHLLQQSQIPLSNVAGIGPDITKKDVEVDNGDFMDCDLGSSFDALKDGVDVQSQKQVIDKGTDEVLVNNDADSSTNAFDKQPLGSTDVRDGKISKDNLSKRKEACDAFQKDVDSDDELFCCLDVCTQKYESNGDEEENVSDKRVCEDGNDSEDSVSSVNCFLNACTQKVERESSEDETERDRNFMKTDEKIDEEKMAELLEFNNVDKDDPDFKFADSLLAPLKDLADRQKSVINTESKSKFLPSKRKDVSEACVKRRPKPKKFKRIKRLSTSSNSSVESRFSQMMEEDPFKPSTDKTMDRQSIAGEDTIEQLTNSKDPFIGSQFSEITDDQFKPAKEKITVNRQSIAGEDSMEQLSNSKDSFTGSQFLQMMEEDPFKTAPEEILEDEQSIIGEDVVERLSKSKDLLSASQFLEITEDSSESAKKKTLDEDKQNEAGKDTIPVIIIPSDEDCKSDVDSSEAMAKVMANIEKDLHILDNVEAMDKERFEASQGEVSQSSVPDGLTCNTNWSTQGVAPVTQDKTKIQMEIEHLKKMIEQMESQILKLPDDQSPGRSSTENKKATPKSSKRRRPSSSRASSAESEDEFFSPPIPPTPPRRVNVTFPKHLKV